MSFLARAGSISRRLLLYFLLAALIPAAAGVIFLGVTMVEEKKGDLRQSIAESRDSKISTIRLWHEEKSPTCAYSPAFNG
ncbi:MAG: hypothetical protein ACP5DY_03670 [Thermovirgaceae bacterium]